MTHPGGTGNDGEVRVAGPQGTGIVITCPSQCERDRSLRLAQARQALAARGAGLPGWPCPVHASGTGP
jgi:hypothetical protein